MFFAISGYKRQAEADEREAGPDDGEVVGPKQSAVPQPKRFGGIPANVFDFLGGESVGEEGASGADQQAGRQLDSAEAFSDAARDQVRDAAAGESDQRHQHYEARAEAAAYTADLPAQRRNVAECRVPTALTHNGYRAGVLIEDWIVASPESGKKDFDIVAGRVFHRSFQPIRHVKAEAAQQSGAKGQETPQESGRAVRRRHGPDLRIIVKILAYTHS